MCTVFLFFIFFTLSAQTTFTTEQYREDLRFLQENIHKDFPFLFKKTTAEAFDTEVEKLYQAIPQMADHEVLVGLVRLVAIVRIRTYCLWLLGRDNPYTSVAGGFIQYDDGVFLQGVHKDYKETLGAKLLAIEGVPIKDALKLMRPVVPAENEQFVKAYGIHYLTFPEFLHAQGIIKTMKTTVELTLEKDGKQFKHRIEAVPFERFPRQYGMVVPGEDWLESRDLQKHLYI